MLFVDGDERGQGTDRALIEAVKDAIVSTPSLLQRSKSLTVNASPNSVSFYRRQGFIGEGEKLADGIRFVPMTLDIP
jgi:predicted GNAT family N-acyltransferase